MGLFDIFKGGKKGEQPGKAGKNAPVNKSESSGDYGWSVWPAEAIDIYDLLPAEVAEAKAHGRKVFLFTYESWSPGAAAFLKYRDHPKVREALKGTHIVQVGYDWMDVLNEIGWRVVFVPEFLEIGPDGEFTGRRTHGGAWGDDIPENIARVMGPWFRGE